MKLTTGQIISISTGIMACEMGEIYNALSAITGDNLMSHQLPSASEAVEDYVRKAHDWVNHIPALPKFEDGCDRREVVMDWVKSISDEVGTEHEIEPKPELWGTHDALEDLFDKVDPKKVVVLTPDTPIEEVVDVISKGETR